jgi:chaperonin cofactor prefoldin
MVDNSKDEKITPLQEKLEVLAKKISTFACSKKRFIHEIKGIG